MKQLSFFPQKRMVEFGGTLLAGKRKTLRPLDTRRAQHFVLKTTNPNLLLRQRKIIEQIIAQMSRRFGVRIYSMVVQADHIHLIVRLTNRLLYRRWIRALSSRLVYRIKGLKFALRPYSKIVNWGRQFQALGSYIASNQREASFVLDCHEVVDHWAARWSREFA